MSTHRHKCPTCGAIWSHATPTDADRARPCYLVEQSIRHKCPRPGCDGHQTWHYDGRGKCYALPALEQKEGTDEVRTMQA